jgi:hypothetical protein
MVGKILYKKRLTADCLIGIDELGHTEADAGAPRLHDPPAPIPDVRFGASEVVITTRCPDFGKVDLEVWAGDPGPPQSAWKVVFDGSLKSNGTGFEVGDVGAFFHLNTNPGSYRVRVEARHDSNGYVSGVRFAFPESPDLTGEARY